LFYCASKDGTNSHADKQIIPILLFGNARNFAK